MKYLLGIDIGSTTAKAVLTEDGRTVHTAYERHYSRARDTLLAMLSAIRESFGDIPLYAAVSGSAGLGLSESAGLPFVQEVFAAGELIKSRAPDTACAIELGGEDAKIIFFEGGLDERMNGTCAGGTGAFIDQMATLLNISVEELDALSLKATQLYPIASRCGVFAKTDIQPLLNQGAAKTDIAASIYQSVVNQTIAGLARGRRITGKVLFLGGPLHYCKGLRESFKKTLKLSDDNALFPDYGRFAVAEGAVLYAAKTGKETTLDRLVDAVKTGKPSARSIQLLPPLFESKDDYRAFSERHAKASVLTADIASCTGKAYLGIDCGSTTTKLLLLSENREILYAYYASNLGDPVAVIREQLAEVFALCKGRLTIAGSAVTGYGEALVKEAFGVDLGLVETIAHYTAAKHFLPAVDFILDIGGQDIKCFKIKNGAIDSILLNEACSSGCGSFLETFAKSMGCTAEEFAHKGLFAASPVNLGSRCTVFMNSSVKQAQKDGATEEDISAGLSISVVKNAVYKVIRAGNADELGDNIVVQGGAFLSDAVLRAFEQELGKNVIRPSIAGLMGAYGAALYSMRCESSSLISEEELKDFAHESSSAVCKGCQNRCRLTVNRFSGNKRYISGNQCDRGLGIEAPCEALPNLYAYKRKLLSSLPKGEGKRGSIGLPLTLGTYELLPLWHGIFTALGLSVAVSGMSTRRTYEKGQFSIPSDTACYPAKIMHGHITELADSGVQAIFYPCLTHNLDEKTADNHYNCPVVAYYSELLSGNMEALRSVTFLYPYLNINNRKELARGLRAALSEAFGDFSVRKVRRAVDAGFAAYDAYMKAIRRESEKALKYAREHGKRIMILAGRPYHIDEEICHGIDKLAASLGFVVVGEDGVFHLAKRQPVAVLNQWTYHARLYSAARYAAQHPDTELVQLVSFGCGVDAITTDEIRSILEDAGKYYTQIKIDEITNLGAVRIRLRSLLGALEEKREAH